ncbi:hypothetical protein ACQKQD_16195 [Methylobacterium sp. NPDC080182]|uniref:hypothetical protein n=1 Tax=Methylobacterium sp. NPDC080182 TaxID=3390590 RepID=UPI003D04CA29
MTPTPSTDMHETAAARTARQKRDAADRARDHRERQRSEMEALRARVAELEPLVARVAELEARVSELEPLVAHAAVDALVVAGLARAVARAPGHRDEAPVAGSVPVPAIIDQCGKAGRSAGGDYAECAHAAGGRLQAAVRQFAPAPRTA